MALRLEVRVPPPNQETLHVEAASDESVAALKLRIAGLRDGWTADLNLIRQGVFLTGEKTLAECGLADGDFVVITGMVARQIEPPKYDESTPLMEAPDGPPAGFSAPLVMSSMPVEQKIERS